MKLPLKINFGVIKNRKVKIGYIKNDSFYGYKGVLQKVIQKGDNLTFVFEDGYTMEVENRIFLYSSIKIENETIVICYNQNNLVLSGFIGFTMFDTYGFPIEMMQEILEEMKDINHNLDMDGFLILKNLQKDISHNNKFSGAF